MRPERRSYSIDTRIGCSSIGPRPSGVAPNRRSASAPVKRIDRSDEFLHADRHVAARATTADLPQLAVIKSRDHGINYDRTAQPPGC